MEKPIKKPIEKALEKNSKAGKLFFNEEDIRWATPEVVADYRAERLKCKVIADIGCGIGFQTFSFAKTCERVYAVEIDKEKMENAKKNAEALGLKNIKFILGDALDKKVADKLKDCEIIFCDTDRPINEDERKIESIKPDVKKLIEAYSKITDKIAIEFPPQIREIPFDCEKEYISVRGKLNRLTIYLGGLKKSDKSAVVLPKREVLRGEGDKKEKKNVGQPKLLKYLYEIDPAVDRAGLISELAKETGVKFCYKDKFSFLTSEKQTKSPFFRNSFEVLDGCDFNDHEIIENLKKHNAKEVELRFNVVPQDYWKIRKKYERELTGVEKIYLFKSGDKAIIAKRLENN